MVWEGTTVVYSCSICTLQANICPAAAIIIVVAHLVELDLHLRPHLWHAQPSAGFTSGMRKMAASERGETAAKTISRTQAEASSLLEPWSAASSCYLDG